MTSYIETPNGRREVGTPQEEEDRMFAIPLGANLPGLNIEQSLGSKNMVRLKKHEDASGVANAFMNAIQNDRRFGIQGSKNGVANLIYHGEGSVRDAVEKIAENSPEVRRAVSEMNAQRTKKVEEENAIAGARWQRQQEQAKKDQTAAKAIADGLKG